MKYVIIFEDCPPVDPDIRKEHMPAHLEFLEANADTVSAAGPLHTPSGEGAGGIWIVNAKDEQVVERLIHEDPFWPTGLRKSYKILAWRQVFAEGKRLIMPQ